MTRRKLRIKTIEYLYQSILLEKDIQAIILDENLKELVIEDNFVVEHLECIDRFMQVYVRKINSLLNEWTFDRLAILEQAILLLAISEFELESAERAIIINEAIELSRIYADESSYAYINGVLDRL
jgi:N utilization substance protein B